MTMSDHGGPESSTGELRLETTRLLLRTIDPADARAMADLLEGDSDAVRQTERLADPCDEAAAMDWIARRQGSRERTFALEHGGFFIGCIGLSVAGHEVGLGYWLGRRYWNHGYATEAGQAIVDLARKIGVTTIDAEVFLANPASAKVLVKLGFKKRDLLRKSLLERGGMRTLQRYQLKLA
jgi:[ribosomal protein S5]-alanine N-acetyltransferase